MSTLPTPSASRGDITLQPSYFTSSLYVEPLREDISSLIQLYSEQYGQMQSPSQPFSVFKKIWNEHGWCWIHFKVFDGRARESFISATERLFLERIVEAEHLLSRVVCLFALYTFYSTQPSNSTPALHSLKYIDIPIDHYKSMLELPSFLTDPHLSPLRPYVNYILTILTNAQAFHILPHSKLQPHHPSILPREVFIEEGQESTALAALGSEGASTLSRPSKKKGRPSKREKMKRAKDALIALDKYLDKNSVMTPPEPGSSRLEQGMAGSSTSITELSHTTHTLVAHPPVNTRTIYRAHKSHLLDILDPYPHGMLQGATDAAIHGRQDLGRSAMERANLAVQMRLRMIDEMAAEKGLEVGGEGGEKTGLARVERAVKEMYGPTCGIRRGGMLGLLEGAGLASDVEMGEGAADACASGEPSADSSGQNVLSKDA